MNTHTYTGSKIIIGTVRFNKLKGFELRTTEGECPGYSAEILIPKSSLGNLAKTRQAIDAAYRAGASILAGRDGTVPPLSSIWYPLRDGDAERPSEAAYRNMHFIRATSATRPDICDVQFNALLDRSEVYSGMFGRACVSFFACNDEGGPGIGCQLNSIQKLGDGPRINTIQRISCDIETYSSEDLSKAGVYRYAEAPDFKVLLFAYSVNGGPIKVVDLAHGERIPQDIVAALEDPTVEKWAFNASFERVCLSRWLGLPLGTYLDPSQWRCSMVWAATLGLPQGLEGVSVRLGLPEQKMREGRALIRMFCMPGKNAVQRSSEEWQQFIEYNRRDVEVEMAVQERLSAFPVSEALWEQYRIDQEINDRGVLIDREFVRQAIAMDATSRVSIVEEMTRLTGLQNPNSVAQMKKWLHDKGIEVDSLNKESVAHLLKTAPESLQEVLRYRLQLAKSSVKKYTAMEQSVCSDNRVRGMFRFYGASRTGRWSGRLVQLQNLRRNELPDLEKARELVRSGNYQQMDLLFDVPEALSQLVRTAFVAPPGKKFIVVDFSAIEARGLAWLANEIWRIEAFAAGKDIYCASASQMFGLPVVKHGENGHLRQKGKIAELALGYGGSVGALQAMGALNMGLAAEELPGLVRAWRKANPAIVRFWWDIDRAVQECVVRRVPTSVGRIKFELHADILFFVLPSGRRLAYQKPRIGKSAKGSSCVIFEGAGGAREDSYGPKFVENIVQAISRDLLAEAMLRLRDRRIVMHIHDEIVIEADIADTVEGVCESMAVTPSWAEGLLLSAEGYETPFYKKA